MNATDELIRLYAKQLKIPSFTEYQEVLRQRGFCKSQSGNGIHLFRGAVYRAALPLS